MVDDLDRNLGRTSDRPSFIRTGSVFVRATHLLPASVVAGACVLSVEAEGIRAWWIATAVTGAVLLAAEYARHRDLHREVAGWATLIKLVLVGGIALAPAAGPWLMSVAFVVAVVGAHAPRGWRHRRLF